MSEKALDEMLKNMVPVRKSSLELLFNNLLPNYYRYKRKPAENVLNANDKTKEIKNEDLFSYLGGFAEVLDKIQATLDQRLLDTSPLTCQEWLLPYFADLLDVKPVSPDINGRREEIARAIQWRQRKGTISVCVEIAEAIGQLPIIAYEGYRCVATTPNIGYRQPTLRELGEKNFGVLGHTPSEKASRPGTPAVMVDFRKRSLPCQIDAENPTPLSETSRFGGAEITWQRENAPHGVPADLGGYQDVCVRTIDTRDANYTSGHHHPYRLLMYTPVPPGFQIHQNKSISADLVKKLITPKEGAEITQNWIMVGEKQSKLYRIDIENLHIENNIKYIRVEERLLTKDGDRQDNLSPDLKIRETLLTLDSNTINEDKLPTLWRNNQYILEIISNNVEELNSETGPNGKIDIQEWDSHWPKNSFILQWERYRDDSEADNCWLTRFRGGTWDRQNSQPGNAGQRIHQRDHLRFPSEPPTLTGNINFEYINGQINKVELEGIVVEEKITIDVDYVKIRNAAIRELSVNSEVDLHAKDSLIYEISGLNKSNSTVELEYCTINNTFSCKDLKASDCILLGEVTSLLVDKLKLRYCCVPRLNQINSNLNWSVHQGSVHTLWPELYFQILKSNSNDSLYPQLNADRFGLRGFGVVKQSSPQRIRHGAEDGGELGAFHHLYYCVRQEAIEEKLIDILPVGMAPVLVVDENWIAPALL